MLNGQKHRKRASEGLRKGMRGKGWFSGDYTSERAEKAKKLLAEDYALPWKDGSGYF